MLLVLTVILPLNANLAFAVTGNQTNTTNNTPNTIQSTLNNTTAKNTTTATTKVTNNTTTKVNNTTTKVNNTTSTTQNTTKLAAGSPSTTSTVNKTIKVLIYSGVNTALDCVTGIETALAYANAHNLIPGIHFTYATSTVINSAVLTGYNLLAMPGGDGGKYYLSSSSISGTAIKNFVANGGGYLGICAGAYAACNYVNGYYYGWGVAPDVNAEPVSYEGQLAMTFNSAGQQILGRNGTISIEHCNGPAMYLTNSKAIIMATYADSHTGYKGYADVVGDYYGQGRSILFGSHPELSPQYPDLIAKAIEWATNIYPSTTNTSTSSVTLSQLGNAATSVQNYFATNNKLPSTVTVNNQQVTMPQFLYLLTCRYS